MLDPAPAALGRPHGRVWRILAGILVGAAIAGGLAYLVFGIGLETLVDRILTLPSWLILLLVFALPGLEASAFIGVVFPGEIAVLVGGVAAGRGSVNLAAVLLAACAGAVGGDQVGYWIGHRYGQRLLRRLPDRLLDEGRLQDARSFVRRTGAKGVIVGRWTAALRALVPGMAGMSHMPYARFAVANVTGGVLWAGLVASIGYIAGNNWHRVQSALGSASTALLGLLLLAAAAWHVARRLRERRRARVAGSRAAPPFLATTDGQAPEGGAVTLTAADRAAVTLTAADRAAVTLTAAERGAVTLTAAPSETAASTRVASARGDPGGHGVPQPGQPARPDASRSTDSA